MLQFVYFFVSIFTIKVTVFLLDIFFSMLMFMAVS